MQSHTMILPARLAQTQEITTFCEYILEHQIYSSYLGVCFLKAPYFGSFTLSQ